MRTGYAVYFKWLEDGFEDSFNCSSYKELALNLADIAIRDDIKVTSVSRIEASGEYRAYPMIKKYMTAYAEA